jgi:protein-L-isoaspartate(D-aspartate) O-methyltransferase
MRRKLVEELRTKGIHNEPVLGAILKIPRHLFIDDNAFLRMAYADIPFPIGHGQTISQPYTVAVQTQLLQVEPGVRILEVGTGCGYQTSVLCELGARVVTIERVRPLYLRTRERLASLGYRPQLLFGDGFAGAPTYGPFDRVLVTCGAPEIPAALLEQLKPEGRVVIPVGRGAVQVMTVIQRSQDGKLRRTEHGTFRFVPMLEHRSES